MIRFCFYLVNIQSSPLTVYMKTHSNLNTSFFN